MEDSELEVISNGDNLGDVRRILRDFLRDNENVFSFPSLSASNKRVLLWASLFQHLQSKASAPVHTLCLASVRLLSRDQTDLEKLICERWIITLIEKAGLFDYEGFDDDTTTSMVLIKRDPTIIIEALKCLCNVTFNSQDARAYCANTSVAQGLMARIRAHKDVPLKDEIMLYDMKLLFILTAFRQDLRIKIRYEWHGVEHLITCLNKMLYEASIKDTDESTKDSDVSTKDTNASTNDTDESTKDTNASTKDTDESTKDTDASTKDTNASTNDTDESTKDTNASIKDTNASTKDTGESTKDTDASTKADNEAQTEGNEEAPTKVNEAGSTEADELTPAVADGKASTDANQEDQASSSSGSVKVAQKYLIRDTPQATICEMMKTLFNLIYQSNSEMPSNPVEETMYLYMTPSLTALLHADTVTEEKQMELWINVCNLLTSVPPMFFIYLTPLLNEGETAQNIFAGRNMDALQALLDVLMNKLTLVEEHKEQYETLTPILTVINKSLRACRFQRKYMRRVVLPPLRDITTLPENGPALRNKLVRLLRSPVTSIKDLAADYLFGLCKQNVGRLVKYTGFGNAAGLLAQRGLLNGGRSQQYSSSSEDSDTEEYLAARPNIDPVVGCVRPPRGDPFAGMTDEQKEYEAIKLVKVFQDMMAAGLVMPARIGPDGRPEPMEHVLELRENPPKKPQS